MEGVFEGRPWHFQREEPVKPSHARLIIVHELGCLCRREGREVERRKKKKSTKGEAGEQGREVERRRRRKSRKGGTRGQGKEVERKRKRKSRKE